MTSGAKAVANFDRGATARHPQNFNSSQLNSNLVTILQLFVYKITLRIKVNMSSQQQTTQNTNAQTSSGAVRQPDTPVTYLCGDCNSKVSIGKGDPVRCGNCGYRVLYKERTKR
jgi:DNA-directed RNA polymerases I, II, and III subunit RPABC4